MDVGVTEIKVLSECLLHLGNDWQIIVIWLKSARSLPSNGAMIERVFLAEELGGQFQGAHQFDFSGISITCSSVRQCTECRPWPSPQVGLIFLIAGATAGSCSHQARPGNYSTLWKHHALICGFSGPSCSAFHGKHHMLCCFCENMSPPSLFSPGELTLCSP